MDEQLREWWKLRYNQDVPNNAFVEILSSLQGHHESGPNWQKKCNASLEKHGWVAPFHEPCLYRRQRGEDDEVNAQPDQIMSRQIDDMLFAIKGDSADLGRSEFEKCVNELKEDMDIEWEEGIAKHYNGIEIDQRREYIAMNVAIYLTKIMENHGWENMKFSSSKPTAPISEQLAKEIMKAGKGFLINSPEGQALEAKMGFGYRCLLGELIFACVVCRLDIAYALSLLARYGQYPLELHYVALKGVAKYCRETRDKPLIYWRQEPLEGLPAGDFVPYDIPDDLDFSFPEDPYLANADVDASHATDEETRKSTGGYIVFLFATAVLWLAKLQPTAAISSTEAEFMQAVSCGKCIKYCRNVMNGIGRNQEDPSPVREDNMAAIMMVNQQRPTKRTRHIDTQWFAIQEWKTMGDLIMEYVNTKSNSADGMTKALGRILHGRHGNKGMGLYGSPYSFGKYKIPREE